MLQIEKLIQSLPEEDFLKLKHTLSENRAVKFHDLLVSYRQGGDEENFRVEKKLTRNAFNVLKSRLYEKIQAHLVNSEVSVEKNFLLQIFNIPHLIFSEDREIALAVLEGIEKEFKENNLFQLLMFVYQAQKKLTQGSPRYYHYSKLYNKNIAFLLSQDKADDHLSLFNQTLAKYYHSRNSELKQQLQIHQLEIRQQLRLNDSPRIRLSLIFLNAGAALCAPELEIHEDASIDELLMNAEEIIRNNNDDLNEHFLKVTKYLYFLYYSDMALQRDATIALKNSFDIHEYKYYYPLVCIAPYPDYRLSLINPVRNKHDELHFDPLHLTGTDLQDENELMSYISEVKHDSIAFYINGEHDIALRNLRDLLNFISFKSFPFSEIEVKILFLLIVPLSSKQVNTDSMLLSVIRKVKESFGQNSETEHITKLIKLVRARLKGSKEDLIHQLLKEVRNKNKGRYRILSPLINDPILNSYLLKSS